ncbi:MAG: carboxypeptidase regulatory-like domain-containing protein [Candidatus Brockarchaeota archaeon]|nr:carboxypeptidase regulatory-like domain-containing protein [Candidatus Brockarchaeota archaeon]
MNKAGEFKKTFISRSGIHTLTIIVTVIGLLINSFIPVYCQSSGKSQASQTSQQTYTVSGVIKDINGNPLSYIALTIYDASGGFVTRTVTFSGGGFIVSLCPGTYKIQMGKKGYESKSIMVSVINSPVDLGEITLDYALRISVSQTYLRVKSFSTLTIPVSIENRGAEEEALTILVEAPSGWGAGVYSGSAEVVNLTLSPGVLQNLELKVNIPYNAQGLYKVVVKALGSTTPEKTVSIYVEENEVQVLSSTYPFLQATPGSAVSFDIVVKNVLTERLTGVLTVSLPEGWSGSILKSDGTSLYGVSLEPGQYVNAKLRINIPVEKVEGDYEVTIYFKTIEFESTLYLKVHVVKGAPSLKLFTSTPYVDAYAGSTARYSLSIENTGNSDGTANFSVKGLPSGYSWLIKDDFGNVLSKIYVKAGESRNLNLFVNTPPLAEPNIIPMILEASSGDSFDRLNLSLGILGSYSISYVTQNFYCETTAGESIVFQVEAKNSGYSSLSNLMLEVSDIPDGFSVKVSPELVSILKPQENAVFSLTVTSDADVSPGDYYITLSLKADQSQATARSLHVYVKQRGETILIGVLIVVIMAVATFMVYRRYGRR